MYKGILRQEDIIMKTKRIKYVSIIAFFIICGVWYLVSSKTQNQETIFISEDEVLEVVEITKEPTETEVYSKVKIVVHVCGAVENPGVYELEEDSRVYQAIAKAGGVLESAAPEQLNQAACLSDGQQLYIPFRGEESPVADSQEQNFEQTGVNINTAGKEELMTLPGIGEAKAEAIISYREEHGDFKDIQELTNIAGIKTSVYEKIKELVRIR